MNPRTQEMKNHIGKSGVDWHHSATLMAEMSNNIEHDYIALIAELDACLKLEPRAVRCCEGGGSENIAASVAITMASVRKERDELRRQNERLRKALRIKHEALEWFAKTYDGRSLSTGEHGIQNVLLKALAAQPEEKKCV